MGALDHSSTRSCAVSARHPALCHFGLTDALNCCLAVLPTALLLLVIAYVIQHARLASIIPLFTAGILPAPVDGNPVPLLQPMVAAFGVVCEGKNSDSMDFVIEGKRSFFGRSSVASGHFRGIVTGLPCAVERRSAWHV